MKTLFFINFLFSFSIIPASADFLEAMLNQKIIRTVDELPYTNSNPEINWQKSPLENIEGWIEIVGFKKPQQGGRCVL